MRDRLLAAPLRSSQIGDELGQFGDLGPGEFRSVLPGSCRGSSGLSGRLECRRGLREGHGCGRSARGEAEDRLIVGRLDDDLVERLDERLTYLP
jgi:hypothetical protein